MRMLRGGGALLAGCVLVAAGCSSSGPSPGSDAPIDALDGMQPGDTAPEADGAGDAADGTSGSDGAVADGADVPEADGGDAPTPDAGGDAPGGDAAPPDADAGDPFENCSTKPTITSIEANLFEPSCTFSACHDSESPSGGLELTPGEARDNLVGVPAENKDAEDWVRVEPGSPEASFLLHRLAGPDPIGGYMPPDQDDPPIEPACRIEAVEAWIADGAPPAE